MAKHWTSAQRDLFEERPERGKLGAAEQAKALEQLQALLIESAVLSAAATAPAPRNRRRHAKI
jgi:hypothetical protein